MLNDLTFDTCVPIFRCIAAQLMQRKIPNYEGCGQHWPLKRENRPSVTVEASSFEVKSCSIGLVSFWAKGLLTLQLAHPGTTINFLDVFGRVRKLDLCNVPGFLVAQSAHRSFPGTVLIKSCSTFSFLACCLLLIRPVMVADRVLGCGIGVVRGRRTAEVGS